MPQKAEVVRIIVDSPSVEPDAAIGENKVDIQEQPPQHEVAAKVESPLINEPALEASPSASEENATVLPSAEPPVVEAEHATEEVRVSEHSDIDADLATTLGRPKVSNAPTGKLGAILAGRSMLAPGAMMGEEGEGESLSDTSQLRSAYDKDQVMAAWSDLIQDLRDKNKMGMAATLSTGILTFEDPTLKLVVTNEVQYDELKECATELLHFLRVKVDNGSIALEVEVGEASAAPKFLTPKDRYHQWASDNPAVEELRVRLDLDLG